jgi:hypothetical protein
VADALILLADIILFLFLLVPGRWRFRQVTFLEFILGAAAFVVGVNLGILVAGLLTTAKDE